MSATSPVDATRPWARRPSKVDLGRGHLLERALAIGTIASLPLVSVPFLPFVSVTAVAPLVLVFAAPLIVLDAVRSLRSDRFAPSTVALLLTLVALLLTSWFPALLDPESFAADSKTALARIVRVLLPLGSAFVVYQAFRVIVGRPAFGPQFFGRVVRGVAVGYAVVAVMALATTVGVPGVSGAYRWLREVFTTSGDTPIGGLRRVAALAYEPSFAGFEYVGWWAPIALVFAFGRSHRTLWIALAAVFLAAAIGTRSLTAMLGLAALAGPGAFVVIRRIRRPAERVLAVVLGIVAVAVVFSTPPVASVAQRLWIQVPDVLDGSFQERGPRDPSLSERAALLHNAVNVAVAYPWTGAGFGLAGYRFADHRPAWTFANPYTGVYVGYLRNPDGRVFPSAKNLYVRVWSETGPFSVLLLLAIVGGGLARAVSAARGASQPPEVRRLAVVAALGIASCAVCYVSLDSFGIPFLWAWLGVAGGLRTV